MTLLTVVVRFLKSWSLLAIDSPPLDNGGRFALLLCVYPTIMVGTGHKLHYSIHYIYSVLTFCVCRAVLNRAEMFMAKKPVKPKSAPVTPTKPARRVYMEEKAKAQALQQEKEERLVKTSKSTSALDMQITLKPDTQSPESTKEDSRTVVKSRDSEDHPRKHRSDASPKRDNLERRVREEKISNKDNKEESTHFEVAKERRVSTTSSKSPPKDLRQKLQHRSSKDSRKSKSDRKESVIDESKFEPDYEDEVNDSTDSSEEGIAAAEAHSTVSSEASDNDGSPAKKVKLDEETGKKKHKKDKKSKKEKKKKKKKKKNKEKKHKKDKEREEGETSS